MSVIQKIREKYAKWAVIAIALALLGFILTDYLSAKNRMFGGRNSTTVGSVNGTKINYLDFERKLKAADDQTQAQMQQQGQSMGENERHQNNERIWNQEVEQIILNSEFEKLGLSVGKKELNDYLFGQNPPSDLKQRFSDERGIYNAAAAQDFLNQMKRSPNQSDRDQLNNYLAALEYSRMVEKYTSILNNAIYYPKWYIEKQNAEASAMAKASYVSYLYSRIADSAVKVSDKEIEEYIRERKDEYRQEESRDIAYVVFDAAPTIKDSIATYKQVADLKTEFANATDPAVFLARYGSVMQYDDSYHGKSQIMVPNKDSIFALPKNNVFGPYLDAANYVMAKKIDEKTMPDSVKARHILIQTYNPQAGQQVLDDSIAKKRIDSIEVAIKGGARFDSLAVKYSDDKGSGAKGGLLSNPQNPATDYYTNGQMVKEFNDFSFEGKTGEMKVVKTIFGYHLVEILDQKNFEPHYKVAYFGKTIVPGDETDQVALEAASKFASESRDLKSFDANIEKHKKDGYQKLTAANIRPNDISIMGINTYGNSRKLVRDIFKADVGDVLQQERVGDKYIVVAVTQALEEGTQPVAIARFSAEPTLRNKKKAAIIKEKIGKITTLEAAASALQDSIVTVDSVRLTGGPLAYEPKVIGAIFNPANKGKVVSEPLDGFQGVYVVRVNDQTTTSNVMAGIEAQRAQLVQRAKQYNNFYGSPMPILRKLAKIKDYRRDFY